MASPTLTEGGDRIACARSRLVAARPGSKFVELAVLRTHFTAQLGAAEACACPA